MLRRHKYDKTVQNIGELQVNKNNLIRKLFPTRILVLGLNATLATVNFSQQKIFWIMFWPVQAVKNFSHLNQIFSKHILIYFKINKTVPHLLIIKYLLLHFHRLVSILYNHKLYNLQFEHLLVNVSDVAPRDGSRFNFKPRH